MGKLFARPFGRDQAPGDCRKAEGDESRTRLLAIVQTYCLFPAGDCRTVPVVQTYQLAVPQAEGTHCPAEAYAPESIFHSGL